MSTFLVLVWRWMLTDCRSSEFRLLALSLWLSTSLIIGLSGFMDKVQVMLVGQSSEFLAADRVLTSPRPISHEWLEQAGTLQLTQASTLSFQTMLYKDDEPLLVSAKAVSHLYPLKGELKVRDSLYAKTYAMQHGPKKGKLWADARLLVQLDVAVGDAVSIGEAKFIVSRELVSEPDRGAGSFSIGPRVLMNLQDIESTQIVQFGSRLSYRYLFAGSAQALSTFTEYLQPQLGANHKWLDLEQSQPSIAVALQRGQSFFLLASSIVVILSSIATAMASLRYASGHIKHIAVLKSLGASQRRINTLVLSIIAVLFVVVYGAGALTGFLMQMALIQWLAHSMQLPLPELLLSETFQAYLLGGFSCLLSLLAFLLPVLWRLGRIPAKTIFQQDALQAMPLYKESLVLWLFACSLIIGVYSKNLWLSISLIVVLVLIVAVLSLPVLAVLKQMAKLPLRAASSFQLGVSQLSRRLLQNIVLCGIFSLCLSLLFILFAMQSALFEQWRAQLPDDSPNFFVVNMQGDNLPVAQKFIHEKQLASEPLYPIVRGRLIQINGEAVRDKVSKEKLKRAGIDRELSMSAVANLPADNSIKDGLWWSELAISEGDHYNEASFVSVESKLATRLGISVGDTLLFQVAADTLEATVASLRKVEWDRMKPNFYMLFEERALAPFAKTYMTSFYLPEGSHHLVIDLLKALPNAVLIDVDHLIKQIQSIVGQVSLGLQWVMLFVLLSSLLVLVSLVQSSMPERLHENAILRSLGASRRRLLGALIVEFICLGVVAGVLAVVVGQGVLLFLQINLLGLPMSLQYELWWLPPTLGAMLITVVGLLCSRRVVNQSPLLVLKA